MQVLSIWNYCFMGVKVSILTNKERFHYLIILVLVDRRGTMKTSSFLNVLVSDGTTLLAKIFKRCAHILWAAVFFIGAVILTSILGTYHFGDPSMFSYQQDTNVIGNIGGLVGSYCAAFVIYLFGSASYILVGLLLLLSYIQLQYRTWVSELDRLISFGISMATGAGLCIAFNISLFGGQEYGGLLGHYVYSRTIRFCQEPIGSLLLLTFFLASLAIIFRGVVIRLIILCMQAHRGIIIHKESIFAVAKIVTYSLYILVVPIITLITYAYSIITCSTCTKSLKDELLDDDVEQRHEQEVFWRTYLTNIASENDHHNKVLSEVQHFEKMSDQHEFAHVDIGSKPEQQPYKLPPVSLLQAHKTNSSDKHEMSELKEKAKLLEEKLSHFGIEGTVVAIKKGPVVTLFEYQPDINARISKITALEDDLALALQAMSIRIIAPIPGTSVIGFEVANNVRTMVSFGSCVQSAEFTQHQGALPLALGVDTVGNQLVVDLAKMPHLLIAGSTGSGKSVALHTMIVSLLLKRTPEELKLILIDPKRLEFAAYANCAHLVFPIVMQPKQTIPVLKWVVAQMEDRYAIMTSVGARNIHDYQSIARYNKTCQSMPYLVVIIDELADLMMTCGRDIEDLIARIAQMARAAGIHMILATQRPSVDVITGLIKVNFPSRVSCRVTSKVDSRTILDCNGAEKLLGRGDMLFLDAADSTIKRVHGAYISDAEIAAIVNHIRQQQDVCYLSFDDISKNDLQLLGSGDDELYSEVIKFLKDVDEVSISLLQRRFKIGYNRSARIIDSLESQGLIAPSEGSKLRKVIHQSHDFR